MPGFISRLSPIFISHLASIRKPSLHFFSRNPAIILSTTPGRYFLSLTSASSCHVQPRPFVYASSVDTLKQHSFLCDSQFTQETMSSDLLPCISTYTLCCQASTNQSKKSPQGYEQSANNMATVCFDSINPLVHFYLFPCIIC